MKGLLFVIALMVFMQKGQAVPNSHYYLYDKKPIKIAPASFNRYALPQLKAMTKEYYYLLKRLHPINQELIELKEHLGQMKTLYPKLRESCKNQEPECPGLVQQMYSRSRSLDLLLLELNSKKIKFNEPKAPHEISALMNLIQFLDEIEMMNYALLHKIEEYLITVETTYFPLFKKKSDFSPLLHKMNFNIEILQTFMLKEIYKKEFNFVWTHFFKKIELFVINNKNRGYLIKHLEDLNLAWNTFDMNVTKGNAQLPKKHKLLVKTMHNRWNSVLKIVLKN